MWPIAAVFALLSFGLLAESLLLPPDGKDGLHSSRTAGPLKETQFDGSKGDAHLSSEHSSRSVGPLTQARFDESEGNTHLSSELILRLKQSKTPVLYFFGDSLIRNQYTALCAIVGGGKVPDIGLGHDGFLHCEAEEVYAVYRYTEVFNGELVAHAIAEGHPEPSVIYQHVGTHLLHLHPNRPMTLDHFAKLYNYTGYLNDVLTRFRQAAPLAHVNVMTTFSICESKFGGEWAKIVAAANGSLAMAAQPCATAMVSEGIDTDVAQSVCERTFFTRAGSMYIRDQVLEAVSQNKDGYRLPMGLIQPAVVVDMWALTDGHCDKTDDGRHYDSMVLQQLDMFFAANKLR